MAEQKLDSEIRREQIVEAALGLVAEYGLRRLSIAALARRVGLVPSGIYRHYKSKDEILAAVLDLLGRRLLGNIDAARARHARGLERLRAALMGHIRFIREGRAIPRIIFSDDVHGGHPERKQQILRILGGYRGELAELVRQGQQEGDVRGDLEPDTAAMMFLGIIVPAGILWHLTEGGFDVTKHAERCWQLFQDMVAAKAE
jgi:AcrR family transcriptional regulator